VVDRLSVLDASFLRRETPATPLHLGGVSLFGPDLRFESVLATLRARLHRIPLGRKRLTGEDFTSRPFWVDDPDFDLTFHLRHAALPPPGDRVQLADFLARLMARPLDRERPLWELYVIEGVEGDGVAVFRKAHLAMAGGDRGDPFAVLLDDQPDGDADGEVPRWEPEPPPDPLRLRARALVEDVERAVGAGVEVGRIATSPARLVSAAGAVASDAVGLVGRVTGRAPRSPLNRRLSPHRRVATLRIPLDDLKDIRRAFGCTVNDVVVTLVADAIGRLLRWRGHDTTDLDLRAMVPVRVHRGGFADGGDAGEALAVGGDGVVGVLVPLPVMRIDPVARLYRVMGEMAGLKESRQAVAAYDLVRLAGFAPPNLHALAARLVLGEERYNLALSNAPGPQEPRWLAGAPLRETYSFLPLAGDSALSVAVTSYAGGVFLGLVGERSAVPDLDLLAGFVPDALADLLAAAADR